MVVVTVLGVARGRSRLISVSMLGLLRVKLVCRSVAEIAVLFPMTVVRIGSGLHRDVGGEGIGGFVEAVVADSVDLLGFVV